MEVNIVDFPRLWWKLLQTAINDYIRYDDAHELYGLAEHWLFYEDEDPSLDDFSNQIADFTSLHMICKAFDLDVEKIRFEVQRVKDETECMMRDDCWDDGGFPGVRKPGFLHYSTGFNEFIERCGKD
jgi:hypothetical protein